MPLVALHISPLHNAVVTTFLTLRFPSQRLRVVTRHSLDNAMLHLETDRRSQIAIVRGHKIQAFHS